MYIYIHIVHLYNRDLGQIQILDKNVHFAHTINVYVCKYTLYILIPFCPYIVILPILIQTDFLGRIFNLTGILFFYQRCSISTKFRNQCLHVCAFSYVCRHSSYLKGYNLPFTYPCSFSSRWWSNWTCGGFGGHGSLKMGFPMCPAAIC